MPKKAPPMPQTVQLLPRNPKPTRAYPPLPLPTAQPLLPRARKTPLPALLLQKRHRVRQRRPRPGLNLPKRQQTTVQRPPPALPVPPAALQAPPPRRPQRQNPARIMLPAVQRLPKAPKPPRPNLPRAHPARRLPPKRHRTLLRRPRLGLILRPAAQAKRPLPLPTVRRQQNSAPMQRLKVQKRQRQPYPRPHWTACTLPCWTEPTRRPFSGDGGRLL